MKKLIAILAIILTILTACPEEEAPIIKKTQIFFDNTAGICDVTVYNSLPRTENSKITTIHAGQVSEKIEYSPGESVPFFLVYHVSLKGINGLTINFIPVIGKDQIYVRVDKNKLNEVKIPGLNDVISSNEQRLTNDSFILLQNNSSFPIQLNRGNIVLTPDNASNQGSTIINAGERAVYSIEQDITPPLVSGFYINMNGNSIPFSGSLVNFERGCAYSYVFNGSNISLVYEVEIKIENIADSSQNKNLPAVPLMPVVTAQDSLLTVRWTAAENAENYEVYLGTESEPPALPLRTVPGTTVVLDGLQNKTAYYVWIKAANSAGKSDFSIPGRGIPWSDKEVPAAPARPQIIPGINRVTVLWEECGGASTYEVYFSTSTSRPALPEITTEKTSVTIGDLVNNTIYYFWIRAVNSAGFSGFSTVEAGTPQIPTAAPDIPSRPLVTAGNRELFVSWQAVGLVESYEVWLGTSNNSAQAQKYGNDITDTETVITGLSNNTTYYIWIKAKNIAGTSGFSPSASAIPSVFAVLPQTPSSPSALPGDTELLVNWQQTEGALSFEVWISSSNDINNAEKYGADIFDTSVTITNLVNETVYYIWIRAKNNIGVSNFSTVISGKPEFPEHPSSIMIAPVIAIGNNRFNVSWQEAQRAGVYEIWLGETNNPQTSIKQINDVSGLSAVITGLTNGKLYFVWIKSKNSAGTGDFSPAASGIPIGDMRTVSVVSGNGRLSFSWNAVSGADQYEVYFNTANTMPVSPAQTITETAIAFNDLNNGSNYYLWVKPVNNYGSGGISTSINGKPIGNIGAVTVKPSDSGTLVLNWTPVPGADQYDVYYSSDNTIPENSFKTVSATAAEINGLNDGDVYNVWVKPRNAGGSAGASSSANGIPVAAPVNLSAVEQSGQIILNWDEAPYAKEYDVYYSATTSMPVNPSQTVTETTAAVTIASGVTVYYFWVKTVNADGKAGNASPRAMWISGGYGLYRKNNNDINFISNYNLNDSLNYISNNSGNGNKFIIVLRDETFAGRTLEYSGSEIEITLTGFLEERTIELSANGNLFRIGNKVTLILDENITLKGRAENSSALVFVNASGNLIMNDRSKVIKNTFTSGSGNGGGINVAAGGSFTMNGGIISGNTATQGGGVNISNNGNFTMHGGKIEDNNSSQGGGVMAWGTFVMRGGIIKSNTSSQAGGGIAVAPGNTFSLHDGIICENTASYGGGVYTWGNLVMNGGVINGNVAVLSSGYSYGGGIVVTNSGSFIMNGGTIKQNTADLSGGVHVMGAFTMNDGIISDHTVMQSGGVGIDASGSFNMNGGVISKNSASAIGGGVSCAGPFTMNGGKICENTASQGGGVYVGADIIFTMYDGTISGNTAFSSTGSSLGGGVAAAGTFTMHGGTISGNSASAFYAANGGGVALVSSGIFKKIPVNQESQYSGIIYGADENGYDDDGLPLKNTASAGSAIWSSTQLRNNTVDRSEHIFFPALSMVKTLHKNE